MLWPLGTIMEFSVSCDCGQSITVSEGSAGSNQKCPCGKIIQVPSLAKLRTQLGLPPVEPEPDIEVLALVKAGALPPGTCIGCGLEGTSVLPMEAVCEEMYAEHQGEVPVIFGLFGIIILFFVTGGRGFSRGPDDVQLRGRDVIVPVPGKVCDRCRMGSWQPPVRWVWNRAGDLCLLVAIGLAIYFQWIPALIAICCGLGFYIYARVAYANYQRKIKRLLASIPEYKLLFDKFPETYFRLQSR